MTDRADSTSGSSGTGRSSPAAPGSPPSVLGGQQAHLVAGRVLQDRPGRSSAVPRAPAGPRGRAARERGVPVVTGGRAHVEVDPVLALGRLGLGSGHSSRSGPTTRRVGAAPGVPVGGLHPPAAGGRPEGRVARGGSALSSGSAATGTAEASYAGRSSMTQKGLPSTSARTTQGASRCPMSMRRAPSSSAAGDDVGLSRTAGDVEVQAARTGPRVRHPHQARSRKTPRSSASRASNRSGSSVSGSAPSRPAQNRPRAAGSWASRTTFSRRMAQSYQRGATAPTGGRVTRR